LFASDEGARRIAELQAIADRNIAEFRLAEPDGDS
jgi:hypothetical protein